MRGALAASYLAVWSGFGLVALLLDTRVHAAVDRWSWLDQHAGLIPAATLASVMVAEKSVPWGRRLTAPVGAGLLAAAAAAAIASLHVGPFGVLLPAGGS